MYIKTATVLSFLLASTALTGSIDTRGKDNWNKNSHEIHDDDDDDVFNIFKNADERWEGAICKDEITKKKFPSLVIPEAVNGGCVRYYQGIDMTGVVTEVDLYFNDGIRSACDCASRCLENPGSCNNWVWKHTFVPDKDSGKRSCTLYSSPNLPSGVTLWYNLTGSSGFENLGTNPQIGGESPFTFSDSAMTKQDKFGVSGFTAQDQNGNLYC